MCSLLSLSQSSHLLKFSLGSAAHGSRPFPVHQSQQAAASSSFLFFPSILHLQSTHHRLFFLERAIPFSCNSVEAARQRLLYDLEGKRWDLGSEPAALKSEIFPCPFVIEEMYGRKACQLVKEFATSEKGQLKPFNDDLFDQVIKECSSHHLGFQSLVRKMQDEGLDTQTTKNEDFYGALIHHLSLVRNKRCLMAYMYNRAEVIRSLRWKLGRVLPEEIVKKLSNSEKDYFKACSGALDSYMNDMNLELTVDMVPPKDPYIQVRVLDDIGEVLLTDRSANLARYSMHFLKRTDAEPYISQGLMEELLS